MIRSQSYSINKILVKIFLYWTNILTWVLTLVRHSFGISQPLPGWAKWRNIVLLTQIFSYLMRRNCLPPTLNGWAILTIYNWGEQKSDVQTQRAKLLTVLFRLIRNMLLLRLFFFANFCRFSPKGKESGNYNGASCNEFGDWEYLLLASDDPT